MIKLNKKIQALFQARGLCSVAASTLDEEAYDEWRWTAAEVQQRVYALDELFENNCVLPSVAENTFWRQLENASIPDRAIKLGVLANGVDSLRQYGEIERAIHDLNFDGCSVQEYGHIAKLKCADVRIARDLIDAYALVPQRSNRLRKFFEYYDSLMELVEDFADINEDREDWNFNFWLTPVRAGADPNVVVNNLITQLLRVASQLEESWGRLSSADQIIAGKSWVYAKWSLQRIRWQPQRLVTRLAKVEAIPYEVLFTSAVNANSSYVA